jgi:hypothetical protein
MRILAVLVFLLFPISAFAQGAMQPVIRTEFKETETIPGQPLVLRITLLVPTWLPKPPVFPNFEIPNVMVRLPDRASGPTSEQIDGDTWSGITRAYRIHPMTAGRFEIPPQPIVVTYADPDTRKPVVKTIMTKAVTFQGRLPEGTGGLDPFIAADDLTVEQVIDGTPDTLEPGDVVTRKITARVKGVTPFFLPPLVTTDRQPGLSVYAAEPVVSETENRGILSGTREEVITYVAEHGGRFSAEPVSLNWYNLKSGKIEKIGLEGIDFTVRGDPPPQVEQQSFDWRETALKLLVGLVVLVVLYGVGRFAAPRLRQTYGARRERWVQSEPYAYREARKALGRRDLDASLKAINLWRGRIHSRGVNEVELSRSLAVLGREYYGSAPVPQSNKAWSEAREALTRMREDYLTAKQQDLHAKSLPPLNPA